jgi:hypothetical protein
MQHWRVLPLAARWSRLAGQDRLALPDSRLLFREYPNRLLVIDEQETLREIFTDDQLLALLEGRIEFFWLARSTSRDTALWQVLLRFAAKADQVCRRLTYRSPNPFDA